MKLVFIKSLVRRRIRTFSGTTMPGNGNVESSTDQVEKIEDMLVQMKLENEKLLDKMEDHLNKSLEGFSP